jgi:hypothetical protein
MATYLLVAHQTAESDELLGSAKQLQEEDPEANFVLLVPATPVTDLLTWERDETAEIARKKAAAASARLGEHGLRILEAKTGDQNPVAAIGDELLESQHRYAAIVLSTLPPGLSRWLNMDVISRARRTFPRHRVIHVVSAAPGGTTDRTA